MILKPPKGAMLNRGHPLSRGLKGCWIFNEGGGTIVNDLSGNGKNGALDAGCSWVPGKFGNAVYTPDSSNEVTFNAYYDISKGFSVVLWYYLVALPGPYGSYSTDNIIKGYVDATHSFYFQVREYAALGYAIQSFLAAGAARVDSSVYYADPPGNGRWAQLIFTWDTLNQRTYVDNILIDTKANTGTPTKNIGVQLLGSSSDLISDHLIVYNRALSASEIAQLYMTPFRIFQESF